ncbi:MAG: septum formation initiator family protein [Bryobacterales bacterium]|nr:septum formation initiator family protein [Bryobacterales bacterium]
MKSPLIKIGYVVLILCAFVYAFFTLRGPQGIPGWLEKRAELRRLERENTELTREIQAKRERIERLRNGLGEQEMEIRRRLKLVRPNEKVYVLPEQDRQAAPPVSPGRP